MIEARYTLTLNDFRESNGLAAVESTKTRWGRWKLLGWVLFVSLATVFFIMIKTRPSVGPAAPPTRLPMTFDFVLPFVPIFFLLAMIGIFAGVSGKRAMPLMWESMRSEQAPRTIRADADGVVIEQATATLRYAWAHFQ